MEGVLLALLARLESSIEMLERENAALREKLSPEEGLAGNAPADG